jgi:hypothetical protein
MPGLAVVVLFMAAGEGSLVGLADSVLRLILV